MVATEGEAVADQDAIAGLRVQCARAETVRLRQCLTAALLGVLGLCCAAEFGGPFAGVSFLVMMAGASLFLKDAGETSERIADLKVVIARLRPDAVPARSPRAVVAAAGVAVCGFTAVAGLLTAIGS